MKLEVDELKKIIEEAKMNSRRSSRVKSIDCVFAKNVESESEDEQNESMVLEEGAVNARIHPTKGRANNKREKSNAEQMQDVVTKIQYYPSSYNVA